MMNPRDLFFKTFAVLAALFCAYLAYRIVDTIVVLFLAIILASTIRPYVERLAQFNIPRAVIILCIYLLLIGGLVLLIVFTAPPLFSLVMQFTEEDFIVEQVREILRNLVIFVWQRFQVLMPIGRLPEQTQEFIAQFEAVAYENAWPFARSASTVLGQLLLVLVMCFYWLTLREEMLNFVLRMNAAHHRDRIKLIWSDVEVTLGSYVRGQVTLSLVVGVASLVGLLILRVPNAPALAVVAALFEFIPYIGPILGAIPAILVGVTISPVIGLLVAGWYLLVQQLEASVLIPRIMQASVGISPLLVVIAIVAGSSLNGVVGAILAIPIVGALQVIARHLWIEPTLQMEEVDEKSIEQTQIAGEAKA
ncbi:MAG: AI-2E family transporter [Caldilineaceae bacterium]|nr:AI-2E family transporter [Caldilineaceae bacterium]